MHTTWNTVARILKEHFPESDWDGFDEREEDLPVLLTPLSDEDVGWLEVEAQTSHGTYDTCYYDAQGRGTCLSDWVPPEELERVFRFVRDREGIAVPADVLKYLQD